MCAWKTKVPLQRMRRQWVFALTSKSDDSICDHGNDKRYCKICKQARYVFCFVVYIPHRAQGPKAGPTPTADQNVRRLRKRKRKAPGPEIDVAAGDQGYENQTPFL